MDDGIELNFASGGGGGGGYVHKKKGGRWKERVKQNRDLKRHANGSKPSSSSTTAVQPTSKPANPPSDAGPAGHPKQAVAAPATNGRTPSSGQGVQSRPSAVVQSGSARKAPSAAPIAQPRAVISSSSGSASANAHAGPSAPRPTTTPGFQIVSSLFSSDPRARKAAAQEDEEEQENALESQDANAAPSNAPLDTSTFAGLGLDPLLERHLRDKMGIARPTMIQRATLGALLDPTPLTRPGGAAIPTRQTIKDAFIQSQTGSGKTLAYLLPILQSLIPLATALQDAGGGYIDRSVGTLAIVLVPTRELARQISEVVDRVLALSLSAHDLPNAPPNGTPPYRRYLVSGLLTGGQTMTHEKSRLRKGCPILIATPGRLLDHLQNTQSFRMDRLMWLVLDEADRLMESGFGEVLEGIVKALEGRRRIGMDAAKRGAARERQAPSRTVASAGKSGFGNAWEDDDDEDDESGGEDYETRGPMPARKNGVKIEEDAPATETAPTADPSWPYWALGRRTILCSATVGQDVKALAGVALKDPVWFRGTDEGVEAADEPNGDELIKPAVEAALKAAKADHEETFTPPSQLAQRYTIVPPKLRLVTLVALLRSLINKDKKARAANPAAVSQGTKIIVFMSCTDSVDFHWQMLGGITMAAQNADGEGGKSKHDPEAIARSTPLLPSTSIYHLHGSLPLVTRQKSLKAFSASSPSPSILLCTSVASRGLDLPLVRAVVQYDLPTEHGVAEYVHRVGRTARVGAGGESWAFVGAGGEEGWVDWVTKGMSARESKEAVTLHPVRVEQVLRAGFGGKDAEYEARATQVQLAMERWVLEDEQNANMSRLAFQSSIRAYSTHPSEEKRFFNVKSLHLGHVAKSFGLREAPGKIAAGAASAAKNATPTSTHEKLGASRDPRKRKRDAEASDDDEEADEGGHTSASARRQPRNAVEARMYEAVRKQGRLSKMGEGQGRSADGRKRQANGNGAIASEFQVVHGQSEMDRLISKSSRR